MVLHYLIWVCKGFQVIIMVYWTTSLFGLALFSTGTFSTSVATIRCRYRDFLMMLFRQTRCFSGNVSHRMWPMLAGLPESQKSEWTTILYYKVQTISLFIKLFSRQIRLFKICILAQSFKILFEQLGIIKTLVNNWVIPN